MSIEIIVLLFLFIKHYIADFLYQPPWQWQNKGTLGHPGGIVHAGQHALLTGLLIFIVPGLAVMDIVGIMCLEMVLHYWIDWAKMNINAKMAWAADTHPQFWNLLGIDQLLHALTYILIFAMVIA